MNDKLSLAARFSNISFVLVLVINYLWIIRYGSRIGGMAVIAGVVLYTLMSCLVYRYYRVSGVMRSNVFLTSALMLFLCVSSVLIYKIDITTVNVDRWEIVETFWGAVRHGVQPYSAQAPNGNYPGALPVYFALMYPFYLIKSYWMPSIIATLLLFWLCFKKKDGLSRRAFYVLMLSPSIYYEVATSSNIYFNTVLFLVWFVWASETSLSNSRDFCLTALTCGLLMSTRQVLVVVVIVYLMSLLASGRVKLTRLICWGLLMSLVWALTFMPIILRYGVDSFIANNPFAVQDAFIFKFKYGVLYLLLPVVCGAVSRTMQEKSFSSGAVLLLFPATIFIYLFTLGYDPTMEDYAGDITYTIFSLPFLLYAIDDRNGKKEGMIRR